MTTHTAWIVSALWRGTNFTDLTERTEAVALDANQAKRAADLVRSNQPVRIRTVGPLQLSHQQLAAICYDIGRHDATNGYPDQTHEQPQEFATHYSQGYNSVVPTT
jgi:hypothetical protein